MTEGPEEDDGDVPRILCGNGECDVSEDCSACPSDCGECLLELSSIEPRSSFLRLQKLFTLPDVREMFPGARALFLRFFQPLPKPRAFRAAAGKLHAFLEEDGNRTLLGHLTRLQKRWLRMIVDTEQPMPIDRWKARSITKTLERGLLEETREIGNQLYTILSASPVRSHFWTSPEFNDLLQAAYESDLSKILRFLPGPTESVSVLVLKLQEITEAMGDVLQGEEGIALDTLTARLQEKEADPEEAFHASLTLLEKMENVARKPEQEHMRLDAALSVLEINAQTLATTAHLPEKEVLQTLQSIRRESHAHSVTGFITLIESLRSLSAPDTLLLHEESFRMALRGMRTGYRTLRASIMQAETPQAEAAALLRKIDQEAPGVLAGEDVPLQRKLLLTMLEQGLQEGEELRSHMSDEEHHMFDTRIVEWQSIALDGAHSASDIREAVHALSVIFADAEAAARNHAFWPLRFIYLLQDFFGMHP